MKRTISLLLILLLLALCVVLVINSSMFKEAYKRYQLSSKGYSDQYHISDTSQGWTLMGGIGSRLDRQITYRALLGASWFEYGRESHDCGWTYQVDAKWQVTDRLNIRPGTDTQIAATLYSRSGAKVYAGEAAAGPFRPLVIDVRDLAPGTYTLQVQYGGRQQTKNIVKY